MSQNRLAKFFETPGQPLVNVVIAMWIACFRNPLVPGFPDCGLYNGLYHAQPMQLGFGKHSIPPADYQHDGRLT